MSFFMSLSIGSTSLGAPCSMDDATFACPMSLGGRFPSYAMMQFYMALPS